MQALSAEGSTSSECFNVPGLQQDMDVPSCSQHKLSAEWVCNKWLEGTVNRFWNTCVKLQSMQYCKVISDGHLALPAGRIGVFFDCQLLVQVKLTVILCFPACKESKSNAHEPEDKVIASCVLDCYWCYQLVQCRMTTALPQNKTSFSQNHSGWKKVQDHWI